VARNAIAVEGALEMDDAAHRTSGPPASQLGHVARKVWRKLVAKKLTASDDYRRLNRFYALEDPWELGSGKDGARFLQTNSVIENRLGRVGSLLEVGCGEGHHSLHLARICDRLVGIDVSERAIARARQRLPGAEFKVCDLAGLGSRAGRFDLVVACEVLYYMKDVPAALARMSALGAACLATFYGPTARVVAPHLATVPLADRGWIFEAPHAWLYAFWRPPTYPGQGTAPAGTTRPPGPGSAPTP
jgi:SAM-dependent methyltransferase